MLVANFFVTFSKLEQFEFIIVIITQPQKKKTFTLTTLEFFAKLKTPKIVQYIFFELPKTLTW